MKRIAQGWGNSMEYRILSLLERQLLSFGLLKWELLLNQQKKASKRRNSYLSQAIESRSGIPMVDKVLPLTPHLIRGIPEKEVLWPRTSTLNDEVPSLSE